MKIYNIRNFYLLVLVIVIANGCTKDFKAKNTPAYLLTEDRVTPELILTSVEYSAVIVGKDAGHAADYCGMNTQDDNAPFNDLYYNDIWNKTYSDYGADLAGIIRITNDNPELVNKKAIARILKAWVFSETTDTYGDIPYFDADLAPDKAITTPKYDTQKSIYEDLFKELKEAAAELDPAKASYGDADLIYKGDVVKWKKFANSLRLRLALRIRYADAGMTAANMADLQESDLILSRDDDAFLYTSNANPEQRNLNYNYLVEQGAFNESHHIGKTVLDILNNNNDPRIKIYADTALLNGETLTPPHAPFGFRGSPLLGGNVPIEEKYPYGNKSVSAKSAFWFVPEIEVPVLRSSEVYFALAEAALFNLRTGSADVYFKKGIEAGINETNDFYDKGAPQIAAVFEISNPNWTAADVSSYLTYKKMQQSSIDAFLISSATILMGSDEQKLEQIINQKILALPNDGLEGWAEWRRTGYPRVLATSNDGSLLHGVSMRRFHYPQEEALVNSANYNEAVERMGGTESVLNKVWWDANTASPHQHPGIIETRATPWQ
ncbi:MAG: SusD/RagB family nutrient-binding outer membrane lipoprotein [Ginsengibacter sp.]